MYIYKLTFNKQALVWQKPWMMMFIIDLRGNKTFKSSRTFTDKIMSYLKEVIEIVFQVPVSYLRLERVYIMILWGINKICSNIMENIMENRLKLEIFILSTDGSKELECSLSTTLAINGCLLIFYCKSVKTSSHLVYCII